MPTCMQSTPARACQVLLHFPLGYSAGETNQVAISDGMAYFSGNGGTCDLFALGFQVFMYIPIIMK